jgi:hypothetical protein
MLVVGTQAGKLVCKQVVGMEVRMVEGKPVCKLAEGKLVCKQVADTQVRKVLDT